MVHIINLFCGIGLFLTGIDLMSESTTNAFGEKLKTILSKVTSSKTKAVLSSAAVTGAIQSSCATTVMAVSFVDNYFMTLSGAVGIIMGANIGTTVTSLLIAFNFSAIAPLCVFAGIIIKTFCKGQKIKASGLVLVGFGLLFLGMNTMSSSFEFLKDSDFFVTLVSQTRTKIGAIIAGFIITAIMQSSSATVGILQSLCLKNIIGTKSALYIILGQNIGAVIPVLLSTSGKSKNAKRTAVIHLLFNILGTVFFVAIMEFLPIDSLLNFTDNLSLRVSVFHIMFNVISTLLLLPFSDKLIAISRKIIRN